MHGCKGWLIDIQSVIVGWMVIHIRMVDQKMAGGCNGGLL